MKILPVINQSIKNTPAFKTYAQSPQTSMQYAYNLPCDTVSFAGRRKKVEVKEDDWLDERDMNSDAILKHLEENNYEQVVKLLEGLEEDDWEPNYCLFDQDNGDHCIMGLTLEKMSDCPQASEDYKNLRKIAGYVAAHKDFKYINDSIGEDNLYFALATFTPEVAIDIIYSDDFQNSLESVNFEKYLGLAHDQGMVSVEEELKALQSDAPNAAGGGGEIPHQGDKNVKKTNKIKKIKAPLRKYERNTKPNFPKIIDEVGGIFQAKKDIEEFIIKPWHKDFRDKIIENKLNRPSGFLLSGPPGCGKTYIMKAIAAQTGYDLYEINLANIGDSSGYKTQNDLKDLFDNLEELYKLTGEPSIVILDELDSIAMDRKNCQTDWKKDDINALLMVINNSAQRGVIVVGATNDYDALDSAVKRSGRLDKHIEIGLPDYEEAKDIADKILADRPIGSELYSNIDTLAQKLKGLSPATISSILHNACLNAIYEYKDAATMEDFDKMYESLKRDQKPSGRVRIKGFSADN